MFAKQKFIQLKTKTMWAIREKEADRYDCIYLQTMRQLNGKLILGFYDLQNAFRFPDEAIAQAVLKFLNRDNLEVTCIE